MPTWPKLISEKAMEVVIEFEESEGRKPEKHHTRGVGYDIHSANHLGERFIEVKGISESWRTYTWQNLHWTEYECLKKQPNKFFLYIVYFEIAKEKRNQTGLERAPYYLYAIPGEKLLNPPFKLELQSYALRGINRTNLEPYLTSQDQ